MSIHYLKSLQEISNQYDTYIIDIWGVVHNGVQLFPGVKECLERLKAQGKTVCFLSNSPRAGCNHVEHFKTLGIGEDLYSFIYTSGDALLDALKVCPNLSPEDPFFFLGREGLHQSVWEGLPGERVPVVSEASYILCTAPMEGHKRVLEDGHALGLPMVCSNPDRAAIHGGERILCAGSIAEDYESMGGRVFYCGKPELLIYDLILEKLGKPNTQKVLCIGDGLFTDIKGAQTVGLDSVFIQSGLHDAEVAPGELDNWFSQHGIAPRYVLSHLT